jgi:uncharacterized protein (TIGR00369 family)
VIELEHDRVRLPTVLARVLLQVPQNVVLGSDLPFGLRLLDLAMVPPPSPPEIGTEALLAPPLVAIPPISREAIQREGLSALRASSALILHEHMFGGRADGITREFAKTTAWAMRPSPLCRSMRGRCCFSRKAQGAAHAGQYAVAMSSRNQGEPEVVRQGPFWDVLEGRREPPPAAVLLGWELVAVDPPAGTIDVGFTATEQFRNPAGDVQGGFLAAMLDDTMGPALVATLGEAEWAPTIDLQVQFLIPVKPGKLRARGRVVRRGKTSRSWRASCETRAGKSWPPRRPPPSFEGARAEDPRTVA